MKLGLSARLVKDGLLAADTLIYCNCTVYGLGQTPQLAQKELLLVEAFPDRLICRDKQGTRYEVNPEDVHEIDGMTPKRYASAYDIAENGENRPVQKKRGRKPKSYYESLV
jgi:hypothetical protein